jgi:hypothetical protein
MQFLYKVLYHLRLWSITRPKYIWYASYGSNTMNERFFCYLKGGLVPGNNRQFNGCADRSLPIDESPTVIHHRLYFAKRSRSWNDGGVAFIAVDPSPNERTLGKMFLIKRNQLPEILQQENNREESPSINFEQLLVNRSIVVWDDAWYGRLIHLGTKNGHGIVTFTHATNQTIFRAPSTEYLKTIVKGLQSSHSLSNNDLANYFEGLPGIIGNYSSYELVEIINNT